LPTVLVVEDEPKLRELLRGYLERDGLSVLSSGRGAEALAMAAADAPDLVVLDLGLPDISGEAVARELCSSAIPIVILTARADEEDRVRGLELGADDYITKPFSPRELVLRVRVVMRRGQHHAQAQEEAVRAFGGAALVLDEPRRHALVRGAATELTATEWGILLALSRSPGRVYSRAELINRVRGYEFDGYGRSVDSHVKNLRRKIERDAHHPEIVVTVLGCGYRLGIDADR
jgi:DNA-binding response OmpR family regulator